VTGVVSADITRSDIGQANQLRDLFPATNAMQFQQACTRFDEKRRLNGLCETGPH